MKNINIGLFGSNGHQIHKELDYNIENSKIIAYSDINPDELIKIHPLKHYENLVQMLKDSDISLISICSPIRAEQVHHIEMALRAGKHVYAEKPAVLNNNDLEKLLSIAKQCNVEFFEMAGTTFDEPYKTARRVIKSNVLGDIIQVSVQKSYPYADWRPQDESIDGGLIMQAGIHAVRFIEHTTGQQVQSVSAIETGKGNPKFGGLMMASSWCLHLENGAIASIIANYLNQPASGIWGNEQLRVFGTLGFLETDIKNKKVRVVTENKDEIIDCDDSDSYLQMIVNYLLGTKLRPFTTDIEFHPLKVVFKAKESALNDGKFINI